MNIAKKLGTAIILTFLFANTVFASNTVLPTNEVVDEKSEAGCVNFFVEKSTSEDLETYFRANPAEQNTILGCAVKSGAIKFWMLPFFIKYILQWVINLAGLIAILMILVGAYYYIYGGITDDKTKGKNLILYALGGLILTSIAWFIVNVVLLAITN